MINKRVIDLTAGELLELFGCSKTSANRIKQSGVIDAAITQIGNLIITDANKALELRNLSRKK